MIFLWLSEFDFDFLIKILTIVLPLFIIGIIIMFFSKKLGDARIKGKNVYEAKVTKVKENHERDKDNYIKKLNYLVTIEYSVNDKITKIVLESEKFLKEGDKLLVKHFEDKDPYIMSYLVDSKYDAKGKKLEMPWYYLGGFFICGGFLIIIFNIISYFESSISYIEDVIVIILWLLIELFIFKKYLSFSRKLKKIKNGEYEKVNVPIIGIINLSGHVNGNYIPKYNALVKYEDREIRIPININPKDDNEIFFYRNKENGNYLLEGYPKTASTFKNGLFGVMMAILVVIIITVVKIFI